jgi:actin-related protein
VQQKDKNNETKPVLIAPNNRQFSCWIGGGIVCTIRAFNKMWISKKDWNESGKAEGKERILSLAI